MAVSEQLRKTLDEVYLPGASADALARDSGCPLCQVYRYLADRNFEETVLRLHGQGLSTREIARKLYTHHMHVYRTIKKMGK